MTETWSGDHFQPEMGLLGNVGRQYTKKVLFCHSLLNISLGLNISTTYHRLWTPIEEIASTARPKIQSQSQIFRYGRSIFCLPHRPNFFNIFDLCLHGVSVVRATYYKYAIHCEVPYWCHKISKYILRLNSVFFLYLFLQHIKFVG